MVLLTVLPAALVLASLTVYAAAWGALGHQTVGYVAQAFLAPRALAFVRSSLGPTYNMSLGPAATWADEVRFLAAYRFTAPAYRFTAPFHFVDAEDSPLTGSCSVQEARDCGKGGCILTAIANYTTRVAQTTLSASQRQEALKFLDHFIGDIGQPLHVEAFEVGGNDIKVKCSGKSTNLHSAWDTGMVQKNINDNHGGTSLSYATDLIDDIKTGPFKSLTADWLSCSSVTAPAGKRFALAAPTTLQDDVSRLVSRATNISQAAVTPLKCPLVWAQESNTFDCSVVFSFTSGQDLCTSSYFANAVPVIDLQIAKQGYRLAAWLNVIFDGATNLP